MMYRLLQRVSQLFYVLSACVFKSVRIQLYIFLASVPILTAWGLPLSVACFWGNLIFAPFMVLFLGFSLVWLFFYYVSIPLGVITYVLECIAAVWMKCLLVGKGYSWYCMMPALPCGVLLSLCMLVLAVMMGRIMAWYGLFQEIALLLVILGLLVASRHCWVKELPYTLALGNKSLVLTRYLGEVYLIDEQGALRNNRSLEAWARYTVPVAMAQVAPCDTITYLFLVKPTYARLQAGARLVRQGYARSLMIPVRSVGPHIARWWYNEGSDIPLVCVSHDYLGNVMTKAQSACFDKVEKGCNTKTSSLV